MSSGGPFVDMPPKLPHPLPELPRGGALRGWPGCVAVRGAVPLRSTPASSETARLATAMLCAATVTGQFVAGKALRDTLFLSSLDITSLPAMLIATSAVSLVLVALNGRAARRIQPGTL